MDEETAGLLDYAWACYLKSEGLLDISSGILRRAWDFKVGTLPEQEAIDALLPKVGLNKAAWKNPVLRFPVPGMELDFGGIGKEYAADRAAAVCVAQGVRHGLVDLGGDITVIGPHPNGDPWRIGIQHPGRPGAVMANVEISQGALASSGDYERCITFDGRRYGHILDPRTGWPVRGLSSVSASPNNASLPAAFVPSPCSEAPEAFPGCSPWGCRMCGWTRRGSKAEPRTFQNPRRRHPMIRAIPISQKARAGPSSASRRLAARPPTNASAEQRPSRAAAGRKQAKPMPHVRPTRPTPSVFLMWQSATLSLRILAARANFSAQQS